jgi:hypothetical protein
MSDTASPSLPVILAGFAGLFVLVRWATASRDVCLEMEMMTCPALNSLSQLSAIPTLGYSDPVLSWISAIRFLTDARGLLAEGYAKVRGLLRQRRCVIYKTRCSINPVYSRYPPWTAG